MQETYNLQEIPNYILKVLKAFPMTIEILLLSLLFSIALGMLVTFGTLGKSKWLKVIAQSYISIMRGIPTLVLIFLLYLGLPQIMNQLGISLDVVEKKVYIIASLSLSVSANMAEMMRSAYLAVDKGQKEAAYSIGMKGITAFRKIILPQAFGVAIPTLGNNVIMLFKETSLAFTVGVLDMLGKARAISAASYGTNRLEVYIAAGIIFWLVCILLEKSTKIFEKIYTRGRKQVTS